MMNFLSFYTSQLSTAACSQEQTAIPHLNTHQTFGNPKSSYWTQARPSRKLAARDAHTTCIPYAIPTGMRKYQGASVELAAIGMRDTYHRNGYKTPLDAQLLLQAHYRSALRAVAATLMTNRTWKALQAISVLVLFYTKLIPADATGAAADISFANRALLQKGSCTPGQPCTNTADRCNSYTCSSSKTCSIKGAAASCTGACFTGTCNPATGCVLLATGTSCSNPTNPCRVYTCSSTGVCTLKKTNNLLPEGTSCMDSHGSCTAGTCTLIGELQQQLPSLCIL